MKTLLVILLGLIISGCAANKNVEITKVKLPYIEATTTKEKLRAIKAPRITLIIFFIFLSLFG